MDKIYTGYQCPRCRNEIVLLTEEVQRALKQGKYLSCSYCSSRKLLKDKEVDNLKELMGQNRKRYTRGKGGAIRQK